MLKHIEKREILYNTMIADGKYIVKKLSKIKDINKKKMLK